MIDHNGKADTITTDEIIGAYEIATIHNGHPSYFYVVGREKSNFALALIKTQQVLQRLHTLLNRFSVRGGVS